MKKTNDDEQKKQPDNNASEKIVYTVHKRDFVDWVVVVSFVLGGALAAQKLGLVEWASLIETALAWFGV